MRPEYKKEYGRALIGFAYGSEPTEISLWGGGKPGMGIGLVRHPRNRVDRLATSSNPSSASRSPASSASATSPTRRSTESLEKSLLLLALVSLSLGLINLLPILPLDGGHIFWSLVEKLRGRPVSMRVMERASVVGFVLVAMLFFIGLTNDIGRITGEGFNVR